MRASTGTPTAASTPREAPQLAQNRADGRCSVPQDWQYGITFARSDVPEQGLECWRQTLQQDVLTGERLLEGPQLPLRMLLLDKPAHRERERGSLGNLQSNAGPRLRSAPRPSPPLRAVTTGPADQTAQRLPNSTTHCPFATPVGRTIPIPQCGSDAPGL